MVTLDQHPGISFYSNLPGTPVHQVPVGAAVEVIFEEVAPANSSTIGRWSARVAGARAAAPDVPRRSAGQCPMLCSAAGRPALVMPHGTLAAGYPVRWNEGVSQARLQQVDQCGDVRDVAEVVDDLQTGLDLPVV